MMNKKQKKLKILLIGWGDMARNYHMPCLKEYKDVEVIGIVRKTNSGFNEYGPLFLPDQLPSVLKEHNPDLAIIATPHCYHYNQTKLCLLHDCHVFVEKPLALNYYDSSELVELAKTKKKLLVVNLQRRYEGGASIYRDFAKRSKIGNVKIVNGVFIHRFSMIEKNKENWRSNLSIGGDGILDDSAYHLIDLLIYFAGGHIDKDSIHSNIQSSNGIPHSFSSIFRTKNDVLVSACGSYISPVETVQEEITIIGAKGSLFIRRFCKQWNTDPPEVFYKSFDGLEQVDHDLSQMPYGRQLPLKTFLDVLFERKDKESLLTQGKNVLETHKAISLIKNDK